MLLRHWSRYPTLRDMVAGYLGVDPPTAGEAVRDSPVTEQDFQRAVLMHGQPAGEA
jgi:hypothetical protein